MAPTTLIAVGPLKIDGQVFEGEEVLLSLERPAVGHRRPPEPLLRTGAEISSKKSLAFDLNAIARVAVPGASLPAGEYSVAWTFKTKEVGDITVRAVDEVSEA
ncbi:MAG: hypothetical protein U9R25_01115 [Chloroflexota bacterium]|nr:hypothetical protein [Chloroflexota bacterium]